MAIVVAALAIANIVSNITAPGPAAVTSAAAPAPEERPPLAAPPVNVSSVRIANTDGQGAFIRRTPNLDDRIKPWPDGTVLKVVGPDTTANGLLWKQIEDPDGNRGWIPAQYAAVP